VKSFQLTFLLFFVFGQSIFAQSQPGATLINSTDQTGLPLPLQIADNPTGLTFGTSTAGRQIRLSRQNNTYYYDMGLDVNNQFFITARNSITSALTIAPNGYVGLGVSSPQNLLDADGTIHAKQVKVDLNGLADFVFDPGYRLRPLSEVSSFIRTNGHLPEIPTAAQVSHDGLDVGAMNNLLLRKVEELTLYAIEQQKQIETLKKEVESMRR
jgi:hypothetical protein